MNKKRLLLAGSLLSLSAVAVVTLVGFKTNESFTFASGQQTNAEYTIATWNYEGWCQNASIEGYQENGRVFMFSSTSTGADPGVKVREGIKLAVILIQRDDRDDVSETLRYSVVGNSPSILHNEDSKFVNGAGNNPVWPAEYLAIYKVRILVGDLELDYEKEILTEKTAPENFTVKSLFVNTTLTYSNWGDDPAGNWETFDHETPYMFNSNEKEIGNYEGTYPYTGIKISTIMVTYGCSY